MPHRLLAGQDGGSGVCGLEVGEDRPGLLLGRCGDQDVARAGGEEIRNVDAKLDQLRDGSIRDLTTMSASVKKEHQEGDAEFTAIMQKAPIKVTGKVSAEDFLGKAKLEVGLGKGKKQHDKRAASKERDWERQKARILKN